MRRLWAIAALIVPMTATAFDLQGHRGARGLAPENTLQAFAAALALSIGLVLFLIRLVMGWVKPPPPLQEEQH